MKLLLTFVLCYVLARAFAQAPGTKIPGKPGDFDTAQMFKGNDGRWLQKQLEANMAGTRTSKGLLANRQGNIAFLPQDHMPCVVPDSPSVAIIPNGWSGVKVPFQPKFHPIPNPASPKQP